MGPVTSTYGVFTCSRERKHIASWTRKGVSSLNYYTRVRNRLGKFQITSWEDNPTVRKLSQLHNIGQYWCAYWYAFRKLIPRLFSHDTVVVSGKRFIATYCQCGCNFKDKQLRPSLRARVYLSALSPADMLAIDRHECCYKEQQELFGIQSQNLPFAPKILMIERVSGLSFSGSHMTV